MISKEKKKEILEALKKIVKNSKSITFVNFHGLSVDDLTNLRKKLREQGVFYRVAKKTLIKRALDDQKIEGELPQLEGEIAITYLSADLGALEGGDDLMAPAREVYSFGKDHKNNVTIVGGIFENKYMSPEEMTEIAMIPSLQLLRGMFVNLINSPLQGLASVLSQIAEKHEN